MVVAVTVEEEEAIVDVVCEGGMGMVEGMDDGIVVCV